MGKETRKSDVMFNTENKKAKKSDENLEEGTKQMREERFNELLHQEKSYNEIRVRKSSRNERQSQAAKTHNSKN